MFQVLWYRDTMQLDTTERRIMESRGSRHTLVIRKVHRSDFGNYTCVADNQLGKTRKSVQLTGKIYRRSKEGGREIQPEIIYVASIRSTSFIRLGFDGLYTARFEIYWCKILLYIFSVAFQELTAGLIPLMMISGHL